MTAVSNPLVTSVSAFFPCYNDALAIGKMVRDVHAGLEGLVDDFEVIVVNDGSRDGSLAVLQQLAIEFPRLRIIDHEVIFITATERDGIHRDTLPRHHGPGLVENLDPERAVRIHGATFNSARKRRANCIAFS